MNRIKAVCERLYHRLHGHLLVTYWDSAINNFTSVYALDVYTRAEYLPSSDTFQRTICIDTKDGVIELCPDYDFTITGA